MIFSWSWVEDGKIQTHGIWGTKVASFSVIMNKTYVSKRTTSLKILYFFSFLSSYFTNNPVFIKFLFQTCVYSTFMIQNHAKYEKIVFSTSHQRLQDHQDQKYLWKSLHIFSCCQWEILFLLVPIHRINLQPRSIHVFRSTRVASYFKNTFHFIHGDTTWVSSLSLLCHELML